MLENKYLSRQTKSYIFSVSGTVLLNIWGSLLNITLSQRADTDALISFALEEFKLFLNYREEFSLVDHSVKMLNEKNSYMWNEFIAEFSTKRHIQAKVSLLTCC